MRAISYWQEADFNNDGKVNSMDLVEIFKFFGCPDNCPVGIPSPLPTSLPSQWTDCSTSALGASLMTMPDFNDSSGPELVSLAQEGYTGVAGALNCSDQAEYYPQLPNWNKISICNSHECLQSRMSQFSLCYGIDFEYFGYGPERLGGVPPEEQGNLPWATEVARQIADEAGKKLMISYGTEQLHLEAEERGFGWDNVGPVIEMLAPYGDMWLIQAADEYNNPNNTGHEGPILSQMHYSPGPEWRAEAEKWVNWIRAANPNIEIWIQLALHQIGPPEDPPSAELLLEYREWLVGSQHGPPLVDGIYISSVYSYPTESGPIVSDQEMVNAFYWACGQETPPTSPSPTPTATPPATPPPGQITLVEEGWTDNKSISGLTILPGYYYRIYENSRYPCGNQGNHQFAVFDKSSETNTQKHLFAKFLGGGVGFWYNDENNNRVYYPHSNAVGLLNQSLNYNWFFRSGMSQEFANGVTKRFRDNNGFRMVVLSYCSHDFYHGRGECNDVDGFCRFGYSAAMEAIDFVQQNFNTNKVITYGGSAGAANFFVAKDQDNVAGIIMDSMAADLGAISNACLDGVNVFGLNQANYPCCCPEPEADGAVPYEPPWCPDPYRTTCMEILAQRIGFNFGVDEPYNIIQRGGVSQPIYLVWNNNDASRDAGLHYWNLHNTLKSVNPGGNSKACRVCLPNSNPSLNVCLDDSIGQPQGACNLHVPTAYDYDYTNWLVSDVYNWALNRVATP